MADTTDTTITPPISKSQTTIDSKYRLIILAAQRSKQLVRGARPRVEMDMQRHKPTRIALEELSTGKVSYEMLEEKKQ